MTTQRRLLQELRQSLFEAEVALHGYTLLPRGLWLLATPVDAGGLGRHAVHRAALCTWVNSPPRTREESSPGAIVLPRSTRIGSLRCARICRDDADAHRPGRERSTSISGQASRPSWIGLRFAIADARRPTGRSGTRRSNVRPRTGGFWTAASVRTTAQRFAQALGGDGSGVPRLCAADRAQCPRRPTPSRPGRPRRGVSRPGA